ncbi:uncharacterized protein LOC110932963 [Helianthus annuus]|uniref:uncharacterized protein LOC110932963 n=1 Tax=Helianthus annuus TaxID=4232 RepID=UPI000B8F6D44|nr:uncharacterized protein LOC110932963 [Helianthus annuus]
MTIEETFLLAAEINDKRVKVGVWGKASKSLHQVTTAATAETASAPQSSKSFCRKRKNNNNSSKNCAVTTAAPLQSIPAQLQPQHRQVAAPVTYALPAKRAYTGPHPACPTFKLAHVELSSLLDAACDTETKMVEMSALNHLMSTHVLQQAQQIEYLYDQAVEATKNVEMGNKELTQAIQRNSSSRTFLLLFLVVLTFSVLFLDWYS